jgi:hypothetical protein
MAKHKYLSNFDYFSLRSDTLLAHWIVIAPQRHKGFKSSEIEGVPLIGYNGYCKIIK